jgi:hypothetical protein
MLHSYGGQNLYQDSCNDQVRMQKYAEHRTNNPMQEKTNFCKGKDLQLGHNGAYKPAYKQNSEIVENRRYKGDQRSEDRNVGSPGCKE